MTTFEPRLFLTDYASYNHGKQFEHGHWVDLSDFDSVAEFFGYVKGYFDTIDKNDPLDPHTKREEPMFTDYEGCYGMVSESYVDPKLWDVLRLDEYDQRQLFLYIEATGADVSEALERYEDMFYFEEDNALDTFFELNPDASKAFDASHYLTVNLDMWIRDCFTRVRFEGVNYLCDTNF